MRENKAINYITLILCFVYAFSAVMFIKEKNFINLLIIAFCTVGTIMLYFLNKKNNKLLNNNLYIVSILFIMISSLLGSCYNFYSINNYDDFLHVWSGLISCSIAFSLITYFYSENQFKYINKLFLIIFVFMFSMGIASLWEIAEYLLDTYFGMNMQVGGLKDTIIDMIDALVGSVIMIPFIIKNSNNISSKN